MLGNFPDRKYNHFFLNARDAYVAGDFYKLKQLYKEQVQLTDVKTITKLIKAGFLHENKMMSKIIMSQKWNVLSLILNVSLA